MSIHVIPQLSDNYAYLICDDKTKECAVVDCAEPEKVIQEAKLLGYRIRCILTTHWHADHSGGNEGLCSLLPELKVYGGLVDGKRIPRLTHPVEQGDCVKVGNLVGTVLSIPAHTNGHVAYYFTDEQAVFTGDTMFIGGCGRVFEGEAQTMLASLEKLAQLPKETKVYCGHEYTEKNLEFALTLEPKNTALQKRYAWSVETRNEGKETVPSTIEHELQTNPFLRTSSPELIQSLRQLDSGAREDAVSVFARTRLLKDKY